MMRKFVLATLVCLIMGACTTPVRYNKQYAHDMVGYMVLVSNHGTNYTDLWVNVDAAPAFLASTSTVTGGEVTKGKKYALRGGERKIKVRKNGTDNFYDNVVTITPGELTVIRLND